MDASRSQPPESPYHLLLYCFKTNVTNNLKLNKHDALHVNSYLQYGKCKCKIASFITLSADEYSQGQCKFMDKFKEVDILLQKTLKYTSEKVTIYCEPYVT